MKIMVLVLFTWILFSEPVECTELIIMAPDEPPLGYIDSDGSFTGISVDILKEIQRRVGNTDDIQVTPWSRAYNLGLRKPNIVLFTAARSAEREGKFHWITAINHNAWAFFARKESTLELNHLDDTKRVNSIGVMRGAVQERYLLAHNVSPAIIHPVTDFAQNIKKLRAGRIDVLFYSVIGMATSSKLMNLDFHEFKPLLLVSPPQAYIIMSKGTSLDIVHRWQDAAKQIKKDGTFVKIATSWAQRIERDLGLHSHVEDGVLNLWEKHSR